MDWFLYGGDHCHERVKEALSLAQTFIKEVTSAKFLESFV